MRNLILTIAVILFITFLIVTVWLAYTAFFRNEVSVGLFKKDIILFISFVIAGAIRDKIKK